MKGHTRAKALACGFTAAALLLAGSGCARREKEPEPTIRERVKAELTKMLNTLDQTAPVPSDSGVDLTATLELGDGSFGGRDLNDYLRDSSIGLRMDAQKDRVGLEGDVTVMGQRFIGGTAIYEDGVLGFQVPELDSTCYTIDLNDLLSQSEEGRRYLDMLERAGSAPRVDVPTEKIMSVAGRYIDMVADTVTRDNTTKAKADFSFEKLEGAEHSGTVWVFTPTAQDVTGFLNRLADELEDDRELQDLLMDYLEWASDAMGMSMEEWGSSPDELREALAQELAQVAQELRDGAEDVGREAEDAHLQCTLYTAQNGAWKVEVTFNSQEEPLRACAEGCDTGFALWAEETGDNGRSVTPLELVFQYEKTGGEYSGALTYSFGSDRSYESFSMELSFEHVTDQISSLGLNYGSYTLSIPNLGKVCLDVTKAAGGGSDHVISLDVPTLSRTCKRSGLPDFNTARLTLHTTDQTVTVSTPQGPTQPLDMAMGPAELEEFFGPWEQRWESLLQDLLGRLSAVY